MILFPQPTGVRVYMMPFIQGDPDSVPESLHGYREILAENFIPGEEGQIGLLTIDEKFVEAGVAQRGRGSGDRFIHTEACKAHGALRWGSTWGRGSGVTLDPETKGLIANSLDGTCAVWDIEVRDTTPDGDLSHRASEFPLASAKILGAGEKALIGIFTPHECIPQPEAGFRQFFRIMGQGVHGREDYFTENPLGIAA